MDLKIKMICINVVLELFLNISSYFDYFQKIHYELLFKELIIYFITIIFLKF
jgi:hypothetical protein